MENQVFDLKYKEEVAKYLLENGFFTEPFTVEDISTGNMNYVYRVKELATGDTRIIKYAAKHTRISEDILVSTERIGIEAKVLMELNQYVPQYVPQVYRYDSKNNCILMKDYAEYGILRDKLNQCEIVTDFADNITSYLVLSIIPTLNIERNEMLKNTDIQTIDNPLCAITEIFVFSEPFIRNSKTNDVFERSGELVDLEIHQNKELLTRIEKLKGLFRNKQQALIHGDLHTGSIFVHGSSIVIFDYEFAFYGPIGFDLGNLLANFIFSWLHAKSLEQKTEFMHWVENTIGQIVDQFMNKFSKEFAARYNQTSRYSSEYIAGYLEDIIHDTAAFAGVELIRRVVGIAHVSDILLIASPKKRAEAEQIAIKLAKRLIMNQKCFRCGADFVNELRNID